MLISILPLFIPFYLLAHLLVCPSFCILQFFYQILRLSILVQIFFFASLLFHSFLFLFILPHTITSSPFIFFNYRIFSFSSTIPPQTLFILPPFPFVSLLFFFYFFPLPSLLNSSSSSFLFFWLFLFLFHPLSSCSNPCSFSSPFVQLSLLPLFQRIIPCRFNPSSSFPFVSQ